MYDIFSLPDITFPDGFLWGSATAGHQIEGDNIHSQKWEQEHADGWVLSGKACDHYHRFREDIDLLVRFGHQAFRMSIEWSRIEPEEGQWDEEAVAHYVQVLELLKESGIKVFLTLHHFTHPAWFERKGGFAAPENLPYFLRYVDFIVPRVFRYVDSWNVINEFNKHGDRHDASFKFTMLRAHAGAFHRIKQYGDTPVSTAHAACSYVPFRFRDRGDNAMADYLDFTSHEFFFHALRTGELVYPFTDARFDPELKGAIDYWAINYYTRDLVDSRKAGGRGRFAHKTLRMIDMDFYLEEMYPEGLITQLERVNDLPVYITENGCCCNDDRFRIVYIALHLCALKEAIDRGVDVRGYFYWSLLDNYEWGSFIPRFGLIDVDFETFVRTPKPSASLYRDIIRKNGVSRSMLQEYLSELPSLKNGKGNIRPETRPAICRQ